MPVARLPKSIETYKFGPFRFVGPKVSSESVRALQRLYNRLGSYDQSAYRGFMAAARGFGLRQVSKPGV